MDVARRLLLANKAWVKEKTDLRSDYFERLSKSQSPEVFWVGCSDSRVPAEEVTGSEIGDLFVHRNIGNQVIHTDFSMLSALQYAVSSLKVSHIIVCGHYGCGGIQSAMSRQDLGLVNKWLLHVKDVYRLHRKELETYDVGPNRLNRLVELNTLEQVHRLVATTIVQKSWKAGDFPTIHGWVYDMQTGYLNELISVNPGECLDEVYSFE